jgi:hypothetical protein
VRFARLRALLAAFERGEFDEAGLSLRLDGYLRRSPFAHEAQREQTIVGMPRYEVRR